MKKDVKKNIGEYSLLYDFYKIFVGWWFRIYYKKVEVIGLDNVPLDRPVILAPNHQNALMDALAILANTPFQPVFMARQDIFKGDTIKRILRFLKILPIYRIRDGYSNLQKNDEVFSEALEVLEILTPLTIMPEGNHGDKRRLRPLLKGAFRIAFTAQESFKNNPGTVIIPVGLDYGHYQNFRSTFLMIFGKPIPVKEYMDSHNENPAVATNDIKDRLARELSSVMIDIQSEEYYELFYGLKKLYNQRMAEILHAKNNSLYNTFLNEKKITERLENAAAKPENQTSLKDLQADYLNYTQLLHKNNYRDWLFHKPMHSFTILLLESMLLVICFPPFLIGLINNYIPYKIPCIYVKKIKDTQFQSSFRYVLAMITHLVYWLCIILPLALIFLPNWWIKLIYILFVPYSGVLAINYYHKTSKVWSKWRYNFARLRRSTTINAMDELRNKIINKTEKLIFPDESQIHS